MSAPQIVLPDRLDQLLAPPRELHADLALLFTKLYERKYTGAITLHFHQGEAKVAEFPAPKISLNGD